MDSNKNIVFSALVILILVVGILFGGGYLYFKYNTLIPTPKPTISTGIYGKVISDSDVQTFPDTPIQNTLIFIYPREEFDSYYVNSNGEVDDRVGYKDTSPVLTDSFGNYAITLNPGQYALCFTTELIEEHKHRILDCVDIEVKENELRKVNISRQFDTQFSCISNRMCTKVELPQIGTETWKTFEDIYDNYSFSYPPHLTLEGHQAGTFALLENPSDHQSIRYLIDIRQVEIIPDPAFTTFTLYNNGKTIRLNCRNDVCNSDEYRRILSSFAFSNKTSEESDLLEKSKNKPVNIIISLEIDYIAEANLTEPERKSQRNLIQQKTYELIVTTGISEDNIYKTYDSLPYVAITVTYDQLRTLINSPLVKHIQEDIPEPTN